MGEIVLVDAGGVEFYAQVAGPGGPQTVGLEDVLSFDGVRETVTAIATSCFSLRWRDCCDRSARALPDRLSAESGSIRCSFQPCGNC